MPLCLDDQEAASGSLPYTRDGKWLGLILEHLDTIFTSVDEVNDTSHPLNKLLEECYIGAKGLGVLLTAAGSNTRLDE